MGGYCRYKFGLLLVNWYIIVKEFRYGYWIVKMDLLVVGLYGWR